MLDRPRDGACDWPEGRRTGEGMESGTEAASPSTPPVPGPPHHDHNDVLSLPFQIVVLGKREHGRNLNSRWRWDTLCRATGGAVARARAGVARRRTVDWESSVDEGGWWNPWRMAMPSGGKEYPQHCRDGIQKEEGLLGSGWRPGGKSGVVEASFLHRSAARKPFLQAVLGGSAPWEPHCACQSPLCSRVGRPEPV